MTGAVKRILNCLLIRPSVFETILEVVEKSHDFQESFGPESNRLLVLVPPARHSRRESTNGEYILDCMGTLRYPITRSNLPLYTLALES